MSVRGVPYESVDQSGKLARPRRVLTSSEQIAIAIQERISHTGLAPGDRLGTEEQLATEYGVSRPTLREALRILSSARLVRSVSGPKGGIFVSRTPEDSVGRNVSDSIALLLDLKGTSIEELLEARAMLEVPLARFAATRASDETLKEMREALELSAGHMDNMDVLCDVDARFHRAIATASGNPIIGAMMEWAFEVLHPRLREAIAGVAEKKVIVDQEREILRALEVGDPAAAEQAMRDHIDHLADLVRTSKQSPGA